MEVRPGYKQTEAGIIPDAWEVRPVGQMGDVVTGKALAVNAPGEPRPYLRTTNVFDGRIVIDDVLTMPMTNEQFAHFRLRKGDVLLNEGQSLELVGRCSLYSEEYPEPCAIQNQLVRFRARAGVSGVFASYLFRRCQQTGVFAKIALQTTSIAHLGGSRFERLLLAWPREEREQQAIAAALSDVDALLGGLERLIAKKRDLKQAAMQQLLTGQTRLPGFDGEWEVKRLGELGRFLKGSGVKKDEARSGDLPCIRYGEIYTHHDDYVRSFNSWISREVADKATPLRRGDVLFAGSGETKEEIGKCVAFVDDVEAYAGGDIVILRPTGTNSLFLGYFLNAPAVASQKASRGQGDAVVHISASALASINVSLPSLDEQTAIAAVLSDMDAELSALEARRAKTRALKQAMMQELLTGRTRLIPLQDERALAC
jgi:type I restriction enzyme S subunit